MLKLISTWTDKNGTEKTYKNTKTGELLKVIK